MAPPRPSDGSGPDGIISTVVGPATGTALVDPTGVAFGPSGDLYFADFGGSRIWRIDRRGSRTVFAGTGASGSTGDEGPAVDATINAGGLAFGPDGSVYIDDLYRYRRIDPAGVIHAFAGTGKPGFSGDGGPALEASFSSNGGMISTDQAGNVYIADAGNHRVRRVDPSGMIATIIGSGIEGYSGDGGPAVDANLGTPHATAIDADGTIYVTDDWDSNTIRRVDPAGVITTVAGTRSRGYSGDCGPAAAAELDQPVQVAVLDCVVYIVDNGNNRIRIIVR
jgi:sugar lactone lactonase YvrE